MLKTTNTSNNPTITTNTRKTSCNKCLFYMDEVVPSTVLINECNCDFNYKKATKQQAEFNAKSEIEDSELTKNNKLRKLKMTNAMPQAIAPASPTKRVVSSTLNTASSSSGVTSTIIRSRTATTTTSQPVNPFLAPESPKHVVELVANEPNMNKVTTILSRNCEAAISQHQQQQQQQQQQSLRFQQKSRIIRDGEPSRSPVAARLANSSSATPSPPPPTPVTPQAPTCSIAIRLTPPPQSSPSLSVPTTSNVAASLSSNNTPTRKVCITQINF
jgi:hypothetical protein